MKRTKFFITIACFWACCFTTWIPAHAEAPREQLNQMVQQLQQQPNDTALREKIIKLSQEVKPPSAVPEEARRPFIEGTTFAKAATDPSQQKLAVDSFKEALKIAPWWGDAYYNLAVAQELAGLLEDAQASLKLYLLTNPSEKDARDAQDKIYALDAKKMLAAQAQAATQAAKAAEKAAKAAEEAKYGYLLGRWNVAMQGCRGANNPVGQCHMDGTLVGTKSGDRILLKIIHKSTTLGNYAPTEWGGEAADFLQGTIDSTGDVSWEFMDVTPGCASGWKPVQLSISPDRRTMRYEHQDIYAYTCAPTGYASSYTFTHE